MIPPSDLKTNLGQITKYLLANAPTSEETNLENYSLFLISSTFMYDSKFVSIISVPLLDAASPYELYWVHSLLVVNPVANKKCNISWTQ